MTYVHPRPDFRLSVAGEDVRGDAFALPFEDITEKTRPRLISLTLTEKRGGEADQLDLVLDDADGRLALPRKGAVIRLSLGWARGSDVTVGLVDKGSFKVDDVEWGGPPDQVTIRARAADLTARFRVRREKGWRQTTLGAVAGDVAAANGLTAKVAPELASIPVAVLAQHAQSDMALLRRLGREHDAVATVKDGRLLLSPIGKGATTGGKPLPALTLRRADVGQGYRYREIDRTADAGVEARWHDQDAGERRTVKVGGGPAGGAGQSGARAHRLRKVYHSEAEARAAAKAQAGRMKRGEAEFDAGLPLGRADVGPEQRVTLAGFKDRADARSWLIAEVTHELGQGGFTTRLKLETA